MEPWKKKDALPWVFLGIVWKDDADDHNYADAQDYLTLVTPNADDIVAKLRAAPMQKFRARDILRAARLDRLDGLEARAEHDLQKMDLEPVLLVRSKQRLHVADGYHRVNFALFCDADAVIPCKLVDLT